MKSFNKLFPLAAHCSKRSDNGSAEMFAEHMCDGLLQSYLSTGINTRTAIEMRGKGSTDIKHTVKKENPLKHMAKPMSRLFTHLYLDMENEHTKMV